MKSILKKPRNPVDALILAFVAFLGSAIVSFIVVRYIWSNLPSSWVDAQVNRTLLTIMKALVYTSVGSFAVVILILSVLGTVLSTIYIAYMARAIRDTINAMKKSAKS